MIRGLLNVEKLSKKDLRKLILFAVGHYSAMLARDDDEMKEVANHVLKTFESEYWLIKPNSTGTRNIILNKLYKSFDLNIDNEKKNRKNIPCI